MLLYTIGVGEVLLVIGVFLFIAFLVSFRRWPNFFYAMFKGFKEFVRELKNK